MGWTFCARDSTLPPGEHSWFRQLPVPTFHYCHSTTRPSIQALPGVAFPTIPPRHFIPHPNTHLPPPFPPSKYPQSPVPTSAHTPWAPTTLQRCRALRPLPSRFLPVHSLPPDSPLPPPHCHTPSPPHPTPRVHALLHSGTFPGCYRRYFCHRPHRAPLLPTPLCVALRHYPARYPPPRG